MAKLIHLPKLKQDIIKSMTQTSINKKYGDLVENIIERKMREKRNTLGEKAPKTNPPVKRELFMKIKTT